MKIETGISGHSIKEFAASAIQAEELGYDGVMVGETAHDPFFPLLIAAEHTNRITISPNVAIAFPRSPMITANISWDLQSYSGGRFMLGLGTQVKGHNERRFSVPWVAPGPRFREYIQSLRAIWDCWQNGSKLDFRGKYYTFTLMTHYFNPGPIEHPRIPIHIAALNPTHAELAGELCDGLRTHPLCTKKYTQEVILPAVERGAKKAGRSLKDIEITPGGFVATGETQDDVRKAMEGVRRSISFYGSTRTYGPVFRAHGWGDVNLQLHEMSITNTKWDEMVKLVTDEMVHTFATVGTYDEIVDKLIERNGGWASRMGFSIPVRDERDKGRLREMIKALKAA